MWSGSRGSSQPDLRLGKKGQVLIESLLLMIVSLGLLAATLNYFRESRTLDRVVNAIWAGVGQMAEYGTWPTAGKDPAHPNNLDRMRTWDPPQ